MELQTELQDKQGMLADANARLSQGLPPTEDAEREWARQTATQAASASQSGEGVITLHASQHQEQAFYELADGMHRCLVLLFLNG